MDNITHSLIGLRFARDPLIGARAASGLRFDSGERGNFTTLAPPGPGACTGSVPAWAYPRADLLEAPAGK